MKKTLVAAAAITAMLSANAVMAGSPAPVVVEPIIEEPFEAAGGSLSGAGLAAVLVAAAAVIAVAASSGTD